MIALIKIMSHMEQSLWEMIEVSADSNIEESGQRNGVQLRLFTTIAQRPHRRIRIVPNNGTTDPVSLLFKEGTTDSALITGDSQRILAQMPEGVFQTCITSSHRSLRNYAIPGQIGLELSLDDYSGILSRSSICD